MELDKLALYRPDGDRVADDVRALVAEAVPGIAWALADAVAERDGSRAMALLETLAETMPEPVIVVVLHRRIRELLELLDRMPAAKSLGEAGLAMGINSAFRDRAARRAGAALDAGRADRRASTACSSSTRSSRARRVAAAARPSIGSRSRCGSRDHVGRSGARKSVMRAS